MRQLTFSLHDIRVLKQPEIDYDNPIFNALQDMKKEYKFSEIREKFTKDYGKNSDMMKKCNYWLPKLEPPVLEPAENTNTNTNTNTFKTPKNDRNSNKVAKYMCRLSQYWIATEFFKNYGATFEPPDMDTIKTYGTTDKIIKQMFSRGKYREIRFPENLPPKLPNSSIIRHLFVNAYDPQSTRNRNTKIIQNFGLFIDFSLFSLTQQLTNKFITTLDESLTDAENKPDVYGLGFL